jgi:DNA-directed RNA polymerase subunit RPC12/RpoP
VSATGAPAETHRFPCAQCGAQLRYAPGQRRLTCEYCGHEQPIPFTDADRDAALETHDLQTALAHRLPDAAMEETRVLNCGNCGAQVQFDPAQHSAQCPFCASPVVADTGTHRHIKPAAVLPFRLTEEEAHGAMNRWLRGLWFAPTELKKYARPDRKMDGLYVPYWAFDARSRARYTGERGDAYYETRRVGKKTERVRQIRWRRVSGQVQRQFRDVLVMAAQSLPRKFTRGLEPWMLADLSPYDPQYLSGFRAEGYTVDLADSHRIALERMEEVLRQDVRRDIGGDEQRISSLDAQHADERFKHVLLPIWMAAYRYRGRSFRFVVNAQTGNVQGERPWSVWKIAAAIAAALIAAAVFVILGEAF